MPPVPIAMSPVAGWAAGVLVGIAALAGAIGVLKVLARLRLPWWPSLVAPAVAVGPALALLVGTVLATGDPRSLLFWSPRYEPPGDGSAWCPATARLGWSLLFFFGAIGAYGLVARFLTSRVVTEELKIRIPEVFVDLGRFAVWIAMLFVVVGGIWRRDDLLTALLTAGVLSTAVLVFVLQEPIKNFIAAWGIVGEGVYAIGDWVWIGEDEGEVVSVTRRTTKIRTRQGDVVTVPNGQVVTAKVRNESRPTLAHAEFVRVHVGYDTPPNRVRDVLRRAVLEVPKILAHPAPAYRVRHFADWGIEYEAKVWMEDVANLHDILSDLRAQVWYHFRREGIEFPTPVRELRRRPPVVEHAEARPREVLARLRSVPFFGALPDELLGLLARDASRVQYGAGERVVLQGEPGETCYVVDAGRLAVLVSDGQAERQVADLGPGDLFGEMSLLTGEPRAATVRALEDARLVAVGSSALRVALERSPELAQRLAETAALRREGLLEARAALDAASRARVDAQTRRLRELIGRFFRLPEHGGTRPPPPPAPAAGKVAGERRGP